MARDCYHYHNDLIGGVYQQLLLKKFISGIGSVTLFKISLYSLLSTLECTNAATQSIDCRLVAFFSKTVGQLSIPIGPGLANCLCVGCHCHSL